MTITSTWREGWKVTRIVGTGDSLCVSAMLYTPFGLYYERATATVRRRGDGPLTVFTNWPDAMFFVTDMRASGFPLTAKKCLYSPSAAAEPTPLAVMCGGLPGVLSKIVWPDNWFGLLKNDPPPEEWWNEGP